MRLPIAMLTIMMLVNLLVDFYIWQCLRKRCRSKLPARIHVALSVALYVFLGVTLCIPRRDGSDSELLSVMWMLFSYFSVYVPKYLFTLFDLVASVPKLFHRSRLKWLTVTGAVIAVATFFGMWWGALINRYQVQVVEQTVWIPDLPESFDGYRILQFSDAHVGTYGNDTVFISEVVDKINGLDVDLVAFTGDIVNRRTDELRPFVKPFSRLKGHDGVYSILGNHDYGDYSDWPSDSAKEENMKLMYDLQKRMGWRLLRNEHEYIVRGRDSIALIGVENVGDPPFKVYGRLEGSYPSYSDSLTKILLSHNPAHWTDEIALADSLNIALTLSGHTHAMQIELLGMSPAVFRYPTWGGMYSEDSGKDGRLLYVNIGLGAVGIPMRLGATPELTVITLRRGDGAQTQSQPFTR